MGDRGLETRLPEGVREWLESELIRRGFSDYSEITKELNRRLDEAGTEAASRSAVHRFGSRIEQRLAALKRSTEIARAFADTVADDEGVLNTALIGTLQQQAWDVLSESSLDPTSPEFLRLSRTVAELTRADVAAKKHSIAVREKIEAKLAALEAEAATSSAAKPGLDPETLRRVREEIYGVRG